MEAVLRPPSIASARRTRDCYIVVANHYTRQGIGEILYTIVTCLSRSYNVSIADALVPGQINILIDEFSIPGSAEYIGTFKMSHPGTTIVIVATEFVTEIKVLGRHLTNTFNYFSHGSDWRYGASLLRGRLGTNRLQPYMFRRYLGFIEAMKCADLVVGVHQGILDSLKRLEIDFQHLVAPPLTVYPEIDPDRIRRIERLRSLSAGFNSTGTLTRFRRQIVRSLRAAVKQAGIIPIYSHLTFSASPRLSFTGDIESAPSVEMAPPRRWRQQQSRPTEYLFNVNPPQTQNWGFSSPMRILRAVLLGQIPLITQKFGDHEIENLAMLWDSQPAAIRKLWLDATMDRAGLIERHIAAIAEYNQIAKAKNSATERAFTALERLAKTRLAN